MPEELAELSPGDLESALRKDVVGYAADPYGFVMYAFPWGKKGTQLEKHKGPRKWQSDLLKGIRDDLISVGEAIQYATSSGHGIGKSAVVAMIIIWALSTKLDTRGVVTANTEAQLKGKTWAELAKWYRMSITRHWFKHTATALFSVDENHTKTWRMDLVAWSENNTEAFAGLHNEGSRILLIFDEASAIPDAIWEVSEGVLTDENTEIIWIVFGNPTRPNGRFRECFGKRRHRWRTATIDSRTVEGTNKKQIAKWLKDEGEDSDFFLVRVRGMFPSASTYQLIPRDLVRKSMEREARMNLGDPIVMSLDVARGGDDSSVFRWRRGLNGRVFPPVRLKGAECRDSMRLAALAVTLIEDTKPDAFFIDATGVGGPVGDRIRQLGYECTDVQFGGASPDKKYGNMRAYMWYRLLEWLQQGGALDDSSILEADLTAVEYKHDKKDRLILMSKEYMKDTLGLASPDDGDAAALLHAYPVAPKLSGAAREEEATTERLNYKPNRGRKRR